MSFHVCGNPIHDAPFFLAALLEWSPLLRVLFARLRAFRDLRNGRQCGTGAA
jgi:hypothetical protein